MGVLSDLGSMGLGSKVEVSPSLKLFNNHITCHLFSWRGKKIKFACNDSLDSVVSLELDQSQ